MPKEKDIQDRTLSKLRSEELITANQEKRLRAAIGRGMSLSEAISKTPLVEPVKFASIQSLVAQDPGDKPHQPASLDAIASTVGALDLDLVDDSAPLDLDGAPAFKIENHGPVGSKPKQVETPEAVADTDTAFLQADFELAGDDQRIPTVRESDEVPVKIETVEAMDLGDDEAVELGSDDELDLPDHLQFTPPVKRDFDVPDEIDNTPETMPSFEGMDGLDDDFDLRHGAPTAPVPPGKVSDYHPDLDEDFDLDTGVKPQTISAAETEKLEEGVDSLLDDVLDGWGEDGQQESNEAPPIGQAGIPPLMDPESFADKVHAPQSFDLVDDEGILLVTRVNDMLIDAINSGGAAIGIDAVAGENNLKFYDANYALISQGSIPDDMIVKMTNRLKVMARIETWKKLPEVKGTFFFTYQGQTGAVYVDCRREEGTPEVLYIYLSY